MERDLCCICGKEGIIDFELWNGQVACSEEHARKGEELLNRK